MDSKEEWFCPRYHETCQALVELEFANARVADLEEWRKGAVNRIADMKSQINHLNNDIAALRQHKDA